MPKNLIYSNIPLKGRTAVMTAETPEGSVWAYLPTSSAPRPLTTLPAMGAPDKSSTSRTTVVEAPAPNPWEGVLRNSDRQKASELDWQNYSDLAGTSPYQREALQLTTMMQEYGMTPDQISEMNTVFENHPEISLEKKIKFIRKQVVQKPLIIQGK